MFVVARVLLRKGQDASLRWSHRSSRSFFAPRSFTFHFSPHRKFPVEKGLPLFPSRGRFTLIQVTPPAKSGSDRWIRILNYYDARTRSSDRFEESLSPARDTREIYDLFISYIRGIYFEQLRRSDRYFSLERKITRLHTRSCLNIFPLKSRINVFHSLNFAILLLIITGYLRESKKLQRLREQKE